VEFWTVLKQFLCWRSSLCEKMLTEVLWTVVTVLNFATSWDIILVTYVCYNCLCVLKFRVHRTFQKFLFLYYKVRFIVRYLNQGGRTGGPHGLGTHFFLGGPGPPLSQFEFCQNKLNNTISIGSIAKVNRLMKKNSIDFLTCTCAPTLKEVPPPLIWTVEIHTHNKIHTIKYTFTHIHIQQARPRGWKKCELNGLWTFVCGEISLR